MLKNNFYVFTGGPGAGKSTLLSALHKIGFLHVSETGRQIIKERIEKNLSARPEPLEFAQEMFRRDYENFIRNQQKTDVMLFDRSFLDSAALLYQASRNSFEKVRAILEMHRFNRKVFIAPPWKEIYHNDLERDQTFEESQMVYRQMYDWYTLNGYSLVILPLVSIADRVQFVMSELEEDK